MDFDVEYLKNEYLVRRRSLSDLAREFEISPKLMYYYIKKFGLNVKGSTTNSIVNESKFSWSSPVFCYYAGLVITDGHLDYSNNRVSLRVSNAGSFKVLSRIRWYFQSSCPVRKYRKVNNNLTIHSVRLFEVLSEAGISGYKNDRAFDVGFISSLPSVNIRMFFRGILDGDGNIHRNTFRIAMKSEGMINSIVDCLNDVLPVDCEISYGSNQRHKNFYPKLEMKKEDSFKFLNWVYSCGYSSYRFLDKFEAFLDILMKR